MCEIGARKTIWMHRTNDWDRNGNRKGRPQAERPEKHAKETETLERRGRVACPLGGRATQRRAKNPRGKWFCAGNMCPSLAQEVVGSLNIERLEESCRGMRSGGVWQPARPTSEILTYPCTAKLANGTPKWINLHIWLYWKGLPSFKAAISRGSGKYCDVYQTHKPVNWESYWLWPRLQSPQEWLW